MKKPNSPQQAWLKYMKTGQQYFSKGNVKEAVHAFDEAITLCPDRVEGWVNLGSALLVAKQIEGAARAFSQAISLNPRNMIAYMGLGDAMRLQARRAEAMKLYRRAVELERQPMALNKLACELRATEQFEEAEKLYLEALQIDPDFTLAKVNLATLDIARQRYHEAHAKLTELKSKSLPATERREVASAQTSVGEYLRLNDSLTAMTAQGDLGSVESQLSATPETALQVDNAALQSVKAYVASTLKIPTIQPYASIELPHSWPRIEGMFMIPLVNSVQEYLTVNDTLAEEAAPTGELLESLNMETAILAARECGPLMGDPLKAELHLRHWHALATQGVERFQPGHFKYTQNWTGTIPNHQHVDPAMTSGTVRHLIAEYYNKLEPGLERAVISFLAICDLHPYADGNGRVAIIWLNRELEWAGLMPALFSWELGFRDRMAKAIRATHSSGGDISPVVATVVHAQRYAQEFCLELAESAG